MSDYTQWAEQTSASVDTLVRRLKDALEAKTAILRTKYRSLGCGQLGRYVKTWIEDDACFLRESTVRLERVVATPNGPEGRALGERLGSDIQASRRMALPMVWCLRRSPAAIPLASNPFVAEVEITAPVARLCQEGGTYFSLFA